MRFDARLALLAATALVLAGCTATRTAPIDGPSGMRLHEQVIGPARGRAVDTLVIVLNGDGTPADRADEAAFARRLHEGLPRSAVVQLLRPGYADASGHRSPGTPPVEAGEHAGTEAMMAVAETVGAISRRYPRAQTILVGSGAGAAIIANLAGTRPQLLDGMVLLSCPCTLPEWRRLRARQAPGKGWDQPVDALDPLLTAGGITPGLVAAILTGADDREVPPRFSRAYAEALALRGISTDFRIVPGRSGKLIDDPAALEATLRLAARLVPPAPKAAAK